jgi:hypothetical protein
VIVTLGGSRYADDVDHIRECFDKTTKLRFRRTKDLQYIKFGRSGDNQEALNISNGQLKLKGCVRFSVECFVNLDRSSSSLGRSSRGSSNLRWIRSWVV